jgi:hypothetical protein
MLGFFLSVAWCWRTKNTEMDQPSDNYPPQRKCRNCRADITSAIAAGARICPECGTNFKRRFIRGTTRSALWLLFWMLFLGTPAVELLSIRQLEMKAIRIAIIGAILSGPLLSVLMRREGEDWIALSVLFAIGIFFVYFSVFFVGCLVVMNDIH